MKILITGGTGFVGTALRKELYKREYDTTIVTRSKTSHLLKNESLVANYDLLGKSVIDLQRLVKAYDVILHAAWYVNHEDYLTSQKNIDYLSVSLKLASAISCFENKHLIGIGTCLEYDLTQSILRVDSRERPTTLYGVCKLATKNTIKQLLEDKSISFTWARLFYVYGDGQSSKSLFPSIKHAIRTGTELELSHGTQVRDFLNVDAAAEMIIDCISKRRQFEIVNICSGLGQTVREFSLGIAGDNSHLLKFKRRPTGLVGAHSIIGVK